MQPVIVIGCHRSGTSILSHLLQHMGVWMGGAPGKDTNHEPYFFILANERLLLQFGATWDRPLPYIAQMQAPANREMARLMIKQFRHQHPEFFRKYVGHDGEKWADLPTHWGWKDPRNTITLAEWLRRFPQAKVIHIVRDQQAVANSIFKRHQFLLGLQYKEGIPATFPLEKLLYTHMVIHSHRAAVLAEARLIWEEYEAIAAQHQKNHPQTPWLSLQYEALLQKPLPQLQSIAEFCGITPKRALPELAELLRKPVA